LFGFVTKHACDGQTNRQNYDSQDRSSIAASRGKNHAKFRSDNSKKAKAIVNNNNNNDNS